MMYHSNILVQIYHCDPTLKSVDSVKKFDWRHSSFFETCSFTWALVAVQCVCLLLSSPTEVAGINSFISLIHIIQLSEVLFFTSFVKAPYTLNSFCTYF